ncbi:MAG: dihydropteroate synthase [Cytophagaceae bacterium]
MNLKDTFFYKKTTLSSQGILWDTHTPKVIGIVNATPDSFFDGGTYSELDQLKIKIDELISEGADGIDIGGYSSRPGAEHISADEEWERIREAVLYVQTTYPEALISIDTFQSKVANHALEAGAHAINDISAGMLDNNMMEVVAKHKAIFVMMHMRGNPQTMQQMTNYNSLLAEIVDYFLERIQKAKSHGINDIVIDPGFGFAKTITQNFELLKQLDVFRLLEQPLLIGVSRKSMVYKTLDTTPQEALNGTTVLHAIALTKHVQFLRVHDVKEAKETIELVKHLYN